MKLARAIMSSQHLLGHHVFLLSRAGPFFLSPPGQYHRPNPEVTWIGRGTGLGQQENRVFLAMQHWLSIHHCFSLCALSTGLLHPGDKIIKEGEDVRKIRQPGGYYSTGHADATSPLSMSRSKSASGKQAKEAENRLVQRGLMISPFLLPCCASAPTASEAVLRYQSGTLGCCKVAASDSRGREISSQLHGHCCVFADLRGCSGAGEQLLCTPNCRDDRTSHLRRSLSGQPNASWKSSQRMFFLA